MSKDVEELNYRDPDAKAANDLFKGTHERLRRIDRRPRERPQLYRASRELIAAVNTAIALGKPLLVAGDPGIGKTSLARYVAWRLGLMKDRWDGLVPEVLRFDVKSTTKGSDLIYRYDAIGHFRESRFAPEKDRTRFIRSTYHEFIELEALGTAIALGARRDGNGGITGIDANSGLGQVIRKALKNHSDNDRPRTSIVLIDEIDKAPRDVPNDLLRELDDMVFEIPELGETARLPEPEVRPIVIITTNNERGLPSAFLRRCCFIHIDFPEAEDEVREIIRAQLPETWRGADIVTDAITLVHVLREDSPYKPATAELIEYLLRLHSSDPDPKRRLRPFGNSADMPVDAQIAVAVFAKGREGKEAIREAFDKLGP